MPDPEAEFTRHPHAVRFAEITGTDLLDEEGGAVEGEPGEKWEALCDNIQERGLQEAIIVQAGTNLILDGWHRYQACVQTGIDPRFEEREFTDQEALEFVLGSHLRKTGTPHGSYLVIVDAGLYDPSANLGSGVHQNQENADAAFSTARVASSCGVAVNTVHGWNRKWAAEKHGTEYRAPKSSSVKYREERDEAQGKAEEAETRAREAEEEVARLRQEVEESRAEESAPEEETPVPPEPPPPPSPRENGERAVSLSRVPEEGDSTVGLGSLGAGSVTGIYCDPPFSMEFGPNAGSMEAFFSLMEAQFREYGRVVDPSRFLIAVECDLKTSSQLILLAERHLPRCDFAPVWYDRLAAPMYRKDPRSPNNTGWPILLFFKGVAPVWDAPEINGRTPKRTPGLLILKRKDRSGVGHGRNGGLFGVGKPVDLVRQIFQCLPEGSLLIEPFAGHAPGALFAAEKGLEYRGWEADPGNPAFVDAWWKAGGEG